ncbi:hypothetical protein ABVT39_012112 [Epinephelus coioides]
MDVTNTKRIVILGKTGAGKSSLVNTIFGEKLFKIDHTFSAGTKECRAETRSVNGRNITLIDTPGFFDTNRPEEELKRAIVRSIVECAPGPHAFLIVLKVEKFTKHEESVISKIKSSFSDDVFKYATVVFTHGDQLDEEQTIEDLVRQNQLVSDLVEKCGGRCHVIDNKYWNGKPEDEYRCNQFHVEELLKTIDNITEAHQGGCYTNENLKAVEREKQQEEEHIRQSSGNISEGEIREQAKGSVFEKLLKKLAHIATGALLGAFYGVLGSTILTQGTSFQAAGTGLGTFAAGGVGAMFGGIVAYDATDEEDTLQGDRRVVILGKTGAGKSSLANTILGEKPFKVDDTSNSGTTACQAETRSVNGRNITLVDTPGFFDTEKSEEELKREIVRCIIECAPGPHAFLIVLKVEKFTEHEKAVINKIRQYFSEEVFKYATVVFTHGDQLKGQTIEEFVHRNKSMSDLVKKCGGRCHVIDNEYWNDNPKDEYRSNKYQVEKLLNTIDEITKANKGKCYTNEMLQVVEKEIQQEEKLIRESSGNMSEEEPTRQAKDRAFKKIWIRLAGVATVRTTGSQSAGSMPKEETSDKANNSVSKSTWIKLKGPAAESLSKAFFGPAVVVLQENKGARRVAEAAEEDTAIVPIAPVREAEGGGAVITGRGGTTVSVSPARIVIAGTAGAGRSIKVLKTCSIVLLGRTGAGKSSLANTIFGEDVFKIKHSSTCGTRECQAESKSVHGRRITLVDTPDFFQTDRPEEELRCEIVRCITECAPGPHAFFIVLKVGTFTKSDEAVVTKMFHYFSEEAFKYVAVVFTHGDQLPDGFKIEEFVNQNKCLSDLVKKCGGRCHVVDNKYWKNNQQDEHNWFQVAELLNTTDKILMENKGGCYTNEMLKAVSRVIQEKSNRTALGNMPQGHTSSKADNSVSKNVWIKLTGPAAESLDVSADPEAAGAQTGNEVMQQCFIVLPVNMQLIDHENESSIVSFLQDVP